MKIKEKRDRFHKARELLEREGVNKSKAAELLGVSRPTLDEIIERYGINKDKKTVKQYINRFMLGVDERTEEQNIKFLKMIISKFETENC